MDYAPFYPRTSTTLAQRRKTYESLTCVQFGAPTQLTDLRREGRQVNRDLGANQCILYWAP
jgi:hypothetical protein